MKLYRTPQGPVAEENGIYRRLEGMTWDGLFTAPDLRAHLAQTSGEPLEQAPTELLPPLESQEVWAAGVTYSRSKAARMEEAKEAGGGDFYDRVYVAERPELFFKATLGRTSGPGEDIRVRADSRWTVPEPELTLAVSATGEIIGYTVGNDVSARDIEGENPLYLPQAKVYDGACALGPCLLLQDKLPLSTEIRLEIEREGAVAFEDAITLESMKRTPEELVDFLFRDQRFPQGCLLMTGTGIVPPDDFTLHAGDLVRITIEPIGTLENAVVQGGE
ncbi:MAG: fumarylacetoacetate hydrolase family protein [Rhodothermales bacterium]